MAAWPAAGRAGVASPGSRSTAAGGPGRIKGFLVETQEAGRVQRSAPVSSLIKSVEENPGLGLNQRWEVTSAVCEPSPTREKKTWTHSTLLMTTFLFGEGGGLLLLIITVISC